MIVKWLGFEGIARLGSVYATAAVVKFERGQSPSAGYQRLARRSLRRAQASGAVVSRGTVPDFWRVYAPTAVGRPLQYPRRLIEQLVADGSARVHLVFLNKSPVAGLLTLTRGAHWMCWLAGQAASGREVAASYLAYDALFADALAEGVETVNLGGSAAGGAEFKHHLGAASVPMYRWSWETAAHRMRRLSRTLANTVLSSRRVITRLG